MKKSLSRPVATRVTIEELAKVRDGLLAKGIPESQLQTCSSIVKSALLITMLLTENPLVPASTESIEFIKQLFSQTKI